MNAKHTPGPWVTYGDMARIKAVVDGSTIADAYWSGDDKTSAKVTSEQMTEANANARLIAAAPDLLRACQELSDSDPLDSEWGYCSCCKANPRRHLDDCALALARAALAKATGEA